MYYITSKAKRRNAKRHIVEKVKNFEDVGFRLRRWCMLNNKYIYEVYNGNWELVCSATPFIESEVIKK